MLARRVTWIGLVWNLALTAFKLAAGIIGHSGAMIADAVHSISDFITDIVVLAGFRFSGKPVDKSHDYGHGKLETLATAFIGFALLLVGGGLFWAGGSGILACIRGKVLSAPGGIAFVAAVLSIVVKEILYRYTVAAGRTDQQHLGDRQRLAPPLRCHVIGGHNVRNRRRHCAR